jgi:hypothetical protein
VLQHTPSTQKPEAQGDGSVQSAPLGFGVLVGVAVDVDVAVGVAVGVQFGCIGRPQVVQLTKGPHSAGGVQTSPWQHG